MSVQFDEWYKVAKNYFVDEIPPLEKCGRCGKEIISVFTYGNDRLYLHSDKSMCSTIVVKS